MARNPNSEQTKSGKPRCYPVVLRTHVLRLLLAPGRKLSFTRRVALLSRRFGPSTRQIFRWLALYRKAGANELRDRMRSDLLTRRAPANITSITPGAAVRLPLDATTARAPRVPS